jgi:L-threonylcarbamoyladenylate synthase
VHSGNYLSTLYKTHTFMPENTIVLGFSPQDIAHAAALLRLGEVVAFPTETVYGLGACVFNVNAVQRVYAAKGRPADNPLIVHCASREDAERVASELPAWFDAVWQRFMPGPLTVLLPKHPAVSDVVSAGLSTVAVRFPAHPVAQALIRAAGEPLVAPSANRSGYPSPTTAQHVMNDLAGRIAAVVDGGACRVGIESTVITMLQNPPVLLRPGSIEKRALDECAVELGMQPFVMARPNAEQDVNSPPSPPASPGMKYRHYAPEALVIMASSAEEAATIVAAHSPDKTRVFAHPAVVERLAHTQAATPTHPHSQEGSGYTVLPITEQNLYAELRKADTEQIQCLIVICDEELRKQAGLMNRLEKAASRE